MSYEFESLGFNALQDFSVAEGHMHYGLPARYILSQSAGLIEQVAPQSAIEVKDLAAEAQLRDKSAAFIGKVMLNRDVAVEPLHNIESPAIDSLLDAISLAREGDPKARQMIYTNVFTDRTERRFKSGSVVKVNIKRGAEGHEQYGQSMERINANSLQSMDDPVMLNRSRIETHNRIRQEHHDKEGMFTTHYMVAFSLASDKYHSYGELKKAGFFAETMSAAIQIVSEDNKGELYLESAFVAGAEEGAVTPQGMDKAAIFDVAAVVELAKVFGIDYSGLGTEEILARPIMIPKEQMKNGAVDLVKLYDEAVERVTGKSVFFGRPHNGGPKDYAGHLKLCEQREAQAKEAVNATVNQLISEADLLTTKSDAIARLHMLNDAQLKQDVVTNHDIDVNVLGYQVAQEIRQARMHYAAGDFDKLRILQDDINRRGVSSSCPSGSSKEIGSVDGPEGSKSDNLEAAESFVGGDKYGSRTFECPKGHKNERPYNKLISNCTKCGCDVSCGNKDAVDTRPAAGPKLEEIMVTKSMLESVIEAAEGILREEELEPVG